MAGGIDWFRWHHGTSGDRKFPLVAKRAGARVGDVIAMWAILLEQASASEDRGHPGHIDFEAIDLALDLTEGMAQTIHAAMITRGLVDGDTGRLVAWERRQPKRERPDDHSTERSRAHRAMQRHATPEEGNATPRNANASQETPREEKSREEKKPSSLRSEDARKRAPAAVAAAVLVEAGFSEDLAKDFIAHKDRLKAPLTDRAWADHQREAQKAGWSAADAAEKTIARSWKGFEAKYVADERPPARAAPMKSFSQADSEAKAARIYEMTGGLMGKKPANTIEVFDVSPKAIR